LVVEGDATGALCRWREQSHRAVLRLTHRDTGHRVARGGTPRKRSAGRGVGRVLALNLVLRHGRGRLPRAVLVDRSDDSAEGAPRGAVTVSRVLQLGHVLP